MAKIKIDFFILRWRDSPFSRATIKCDFTVHIANLFFPIIPIQLKKNHSKFLLIKFCIWKSQNYSGNLTQEIYYTTESCQVLAFLFEQLVHIHIVHLSLQYFNSFRLLPKKRSPCQFKTIEGNKLLARKIYLPNRFTSRIGQIMVWFCVVYWYS